ncbi:MAG: S8 family serine peptidase, partial [Halovenus sp.]
MTENTTGVSRRDVLRSAGAVGALGVAGAGTTGTGAADGPEGHIVGVAPGRADIAQREADSVRRTHDFGDIGMAVAGQFSDQALAALQNNPNIRYVEENGEMRALAQTLPWGIDRVDADVLHGNGETGNGADLAILDTGIDDDHPDLQANVGAGKAFVDCKGRNCNEAWSDDDNHGTHCAGIADAVDNSEGVVGVSTEATLHAVKVLDKNGSGSFSDVAAGIEY